jgi:hypothetical protein
VQVLGFVQAGVCKLGCSYWVLRWGVQVCGFSWGVQDGVSLPTTTYATYDAMSA